MMQHAHANKCSAIPPSCMYVWMDVCMYVQYLSMRSGPSPSSAFFSITYITKKCKGAMSTGSSSPGKNTDGQTDGCISEAAKSINVMIRRARARVVGLGRTR